MSPRERLTLNVLGVLGVLAVFEVVSRSDIVPARYLPPPTVLVVRLAGLSTDQGFLGAVGDTLAAWALAMVLATAAAVPLGIMIGSIASLRQAAAAVIDLLRPIPSVALLPVAILLLGLGTQMKVAMASYAIVWPLLINTIYGVHQVDRVMLDTARTFHWRRGTVMWRITLPSAAPHIATGVRIAAAVSLIVVMTAEVLAARSGLGTVIRSYQEADRPDFVYAGILATGLLGLAVNSALSVLQHRWLRWAPGYRDA